MNERLENAPGMLTILGLALFFYSQYEPTVSWPSFDAVVRDFSAVTGIVMAVVLSDRITKHDISFINSSAHRKAGMLRLQVLLPAANILLPYMSFIVLLYVLCRVGGTSGSPWYLGIVSGMFWVIVACPAIAAYISLLLRSRRYYANLSTLAVSLSILVSSYLSNSVSFLPRFGIFWTDNFASSRPWAIGPQGSELSIPSVATISSISLLCAFLTWLAFYFEVRGSSAPARALLSIGFVLTLGSGILVNTVTGNSSVLEPRPSTVRPACVEDDYARIRFCGWPEDGDVIAKMKRSWSDYVNELDEIGIPLDSRTISVQGVLDKPDIEISGISFRSTSSVFTRSTTALLNNDIQKCGDSLNPSAKVALRRIVEGIADVMSTEFGDRKGWHLMNSKKINFNNFKEKSDLRIAIRAIEDCNPNLV
ncbi:hypothetical protein [Corynebacterium lactis]|uniref:hypothetical protein n=1 Tax=Corynebacterium lactis TaxID=1231000 RepID=UPI0012E3126C|nr:hypothetical protein [Corynebacterium lactis]